jgi:hypothetical protein
MPWPVWLIYDLYPICTRLSKQLPSLWVDLTGVSDGIRKYVFIHNNMFLSLVWLVSQHEGILLYLIIKSIKATSMLERLDGSWLWLHGGGCTGCWYLLSLPPCSPRMSDVHVHYTLANLSRRGNTINFIVWELMLSVLSWDLWTVAWGSLSMAGFASGEEDKTSCAS